MKTLLVAAIAAAVALTPTSAVVGQDAPKTLRVPNFHRVNASLYRGAQPEKDDFRGLADLGIKTVLNLRASDANAVKEARPVRTLGLKYVNLPLHRLGKPEPETITQILELLESPDNQPVFVHCQHGADRTGLVVAIYRVVHDGWTAAQAIDEANRYGMKFWQRGMKEFIRSYTKRSRAAQSVTER